MIRTSKGSTGFSADLALEVTDVSAGYGQADVVRNVSLSLRTGTVLALVGPNGAGKSTLLRAISGLIIPSSGVVKFGGVEVTGRSPDWRARRGLCHIPEGRGIYRSLTVRENLTLQVDRRGGKEAVDRATAVFPDLGKRLDQIAGTLSGGQQQMVSLSAAYVRNPKVIVVDEPSLGLAPIIVDAVFEFLASVAKEKVAMLVVDQFVDQVLDLADHVVHLQRGAVHFSGTALEFREMDKFALYVGDA